MADYVRFPTDMWTGAARKADPDLTLLRAFYMSHPNQTIDGISRCSDGFVADFLRFSKQKIASLRRQLIDEGFIAFDEDTDEMYLTGFLAQNPPRSGTNAISLKKNIERLRSKTLRDIIIGEVGASMQARLAEYQEQRARKQRQDGRGLDHHDHGLNSNRANLASDALQRLMKSQGGNQ